MDSIATILGRRGWSMAGTAPHSGIIKAPAPSMASRTQRGGGAARLPSLMYFRSSTWPTFMIRTEDEMNRNVRESQSLSSCREITSVVVGLTIAVSLCASAISMATTRDTLMMRRARHLLATAPQYITDNRQISGKPPAKKDAADATPERGHGSSRERQRSKTCETPRDLSRW
jgi:hypothetical protein